MSSRFLQSEPGAEPVVVEALYRAPVSRVFAAWTEPDKIMKWFGPSPGSLTSAEIDLRVGGKWRFTLSANEEGRSYLQGQYDEVVLDRCLRFSWSHVREAADGSTEQTPYSTVTVDFEPHGVATRVRLRHEHIIEQAGRQGVGHGWETTFGHLEDVLAAQSG